jgi:hypothetical protein
LLTAVVALFSLLLVTLFALMASRTGGWRGGLVGVALLLGWIAWLAVGPKP